MDKKVINGIQQIGIGTSDVQATFEWYKTHLGFDIKVFEDEATAELMLPYTAGKPRTRHAILSMNMRGGGGLEIWQYKDRTPEAAPFEIKLGDFGVNSMKIRSVNANKSLKDPWNNLIEICEDDYEFSNEKTSFGGVLGTTIGVSNLDKSIEFYSKTLGYDQVVFNTSGTFDDFNGLAGGEDNCNRVLLRHSKTRKSGGFSKLYGPTELELVQSLDRHQKKIYEGRLWGDLGYIHLCFDVNGMELLREECAKSGTPFTVDSSNSFDMGDAAGHLSAANREPINFI